MVKEKVKKIIDSAQKQQQLILEKEEVLNVIKQLKKKKAKDLDGWNNEMIICRRRR